MSERKFLNSGVVKAAVESMPLSNIFTVVFEKADGNLRQMTCRRGVTKKLKGGVSTVARGNLGVYDMGAKDPDGNPGAYRSFNMSKVVSIKGTSKDDKPFEIIVQGLDLTEEKVVLCDGKEKQPKATQPRFSN